MTDPVGRANGSPRFDLLGEVALITAATSGLGRAIAMAVAHAGADVGLGTPAVGRWSEWCCRALGGRAAAHDWAPPRSGDG